MKYSTYHRNHVIIPGREGALYNFLDATLNRNGIRQKHKWQHAVSSNSEDALTWSCFDVLRNQPEEKIKVALDEIFEDAYGDFKEEARPAKFSFAGERNIEIHIGKNYYATSVGEDTEVDVSIETTGKLIFIEAKLYSKISLPDEHTPYDQIIRKIRIGLDVANASSKEFYFIFLDIAPINYLVNLDKDKSISAKHFKKYKENDNELGECLTDIPHNDVKKIQVNMGWLAWASLFKTVLRSHI
ncbi:MAG: hypothetical protein LBC81_00060 [Tannerellaceae bacterium]|jgi:hypothetical protein|nr:hypothetical protein [Tannerellaceae bacterium]